MKVATFNSNPSTTIISCYNPANTSDEKDLDIFYYELSSLFVASRLGNVLIIWGNMILELLKMKTNSACTAHLKEMWSP